MIEFLFSQGKDGVFISNSWVFNDSQLSHKIFVYYHSIEKRLICEVGNEYDKKTGDWQRVGNAGKYIDEVPKEVYLKDLLLEHPVALYVREKGLKL